MPYTACADNCGSIGSNFRMCMQPSDVVLPCDVALFGGLSPRYEILAENLEYTDVTVGSRGLTGSLDPIANHLRGGARLVQGSITMEVGPNELADLAPYILGGDSNGDVDSTGPIFQARPLDFLMDREGGSKAYRHCLVSSAVIRGQTATGQDKEAQVITLTLGIVGLEEHDEAWPSPGPDLPTDQHNFWLFGDSIFTLDAVEYSIDNFVLVIDNMVRPKTRNNLRATCLRSYGRSIRFMAQTPYNAASDAALYVLRHDGPGVLQFDGAKNLTGLPGAGDDTTFTFARLYQTRKTPATRGKGEIPLMLDMQAYRTDSEEPLTISNTIT